MALITAIVIVLQSTRVSQLIANKTATITATAATFTESRKALSSLDFLIRGTSGFKTRTNRKEGRNIPAVAANAPQKPVS